MLTIGTIPIGVVASNACSLGVRPAADNCCLMYSRVLWMPGEPAGRGPISTSCFRCAKARFESKAGACAAGGGDGVCAETQAQVTRTAAAARQNRIFHLTPDINVGPTARLDKWSAPERCKARLRVAANGAPRFARSPQPSQALLGRAQSGAV